MRRFILEANVARYYKLLEHERDEAARATIRQLLSADRRELTLLEAALYGASNESGPPATVARDGRDLPNEQGFRREFSRSPRALLLLDAGPQLRIVDANASFCVAAGRRREDLVGRPVFEAFPENPDDPLAEGVSRYYASLRTAARSHRPHIEEARRYDVQAADGRFEERYWRVINTPLFDGYGRLAYLLSEGIEATAEFVTASTDAPEAGVDQLTRSSLQARVPDNAR